MPNPEYLLECPHCGAGLEPHAGEPASAPWVCHNCYRGWWVAELSQEARGMYRPTAGDWGYGAGANALRAAVLTEIEQAQHRGTSTLHEHLGLLTQDQLSFLHDHFTLHSSFRTQIKAALK